MTKCFRLACIAILSAIFLLPCKASAEQTATVYTSLKSVLMKQIASGFAKAYPGYAINYVSSGSGALRNEVEQQIKSGQLKADVLMVSDLEEFINLEYRHLLKPYKSPALAEVMPGLYNEHVPFLVVRLSTMGIVYNRRLVETPPASWQALVDPRNAGKVAIANPEVSGTSNSAIRVLSNGFARDYRKIFNDLKVHYTQSAEEVVSCVAAGKVPLGLGVDYLVLGEMERNFDLGFSLPSQLVLMPTSIAILANSAHEKVAKAFVDYMLSKEVQEIFARQGSIPVRNDLLLHPLLPVKSLDEAIARAIKRS